MYLEAKQSINRKSGDSKSRLSEVVARLRNDIRLSIVTLYCLCLALLITPFGIFRLSVGDLAIGLADLGIVMLFISLLVLAWRTGKTQLAADLTAIAAALAVVGVVLILDLSYLWTFSTLVGNFLMARLRVAIVVSLVLVLSVGLHAGAFDGPTERATYLAVSALVSLFSFIFAARINHRHGQLSDLISTDALTGAFNRRALDYDLQTICQQGCPPDHCLVMMDVDNFKRLNDKAGHGAGDRVLMALADIVSAQTRQADRFYRYGGEEFVLLLADTDRAGAEAVTRKLQDALRRQLLGPRGIVTVSMGLAERREGETASDWLFRADKALLSAKRTGKDRVVTAA